jgi:hypothetical protein
MCGRIADLLAEKIPPQQAAEFKGWLLGIAETVVNAEVQGIGPGIEGTPESDLEATALSALAGALRIST